MVARHRSHGERTKRRVIRAQSSRLQSRLSNDSSRFSRHGYPRHARTGRAAAHRPPPGTRARTADRGRPRRRASAAERLAEAVRDAGWLELRHDGGDGDPLASGVEAAIIADALGEAVADVPFAGPILAADLARRAGAQPHRRRGASPSRRDLIDAAVVVGSRPRTRRSYAVDHASAGSGRRHTSWFPKATATASRTCRSRARATAPTSRARSAPHPGRRAAAPVPGQSSAPHARRSRRPGRRSAWRSRAPIWSGSCGACSTSRSPTRRNGSSTASPSERSRPCSTCSPRRTA